MLQWHRVKITPTSSDTGSYEAWHDVFPNLVRKSWQLFFDFTFWPRIVFQNGWEAQKLWRSWPKALGFSWFSLGGGGFCLLSRTWCWRETNLWFADMYYHIYIYMCVCVYVHVFIHINTCVCVCKKNVIMLQYAAISAPKLPWKCVLIHSVWYPGHIYLPN